MNGNRSGQAPGPERVVPSWALAGACPLNLLGIMMRNVVFTCD